MKSDNVTIAGLTAEDIMTFERFYQRRLAEVGGARDDFQELEIAREILVTVTDHGLTPTADGGESFVRRDAVDWSDITNIQAAQATIQDDNSAKQQQQTKKQGTARAGGGLFRSGTFQTIGIIAVVVLGVAYFFFWPDGSKQGAGENVEAVAEEEGVALAASSEEAVESDGVYMPTPTPKPTLEAGLLEEVVGDGAKVKDTVVPRTLEIKGVSFVIQPVNIKIGGWPRPGVDRAVSWVNGSVINYIMGMNAIPENKELLASLQSGDQLLVRMSTGQAYRFIYNETIRAAPQAVEMFWQSRPGLTLVLFSGDEEEETRIVIRALYVPETDLAEADDSTPPVKTTVAGQRVVLDDKLVVTYLGRDIVPAPSTLHGYAYIGVNVSVEHLGGALPLLSTSFMHRIMEFDGFAYPTVSAGNTRFPPLPERLVADVPYTTTIVYAVPQSSLRHEMLWEFAPDPAGGTQVQAVLSAYEGVLSPVVEVGEYEINENRDLELSLTIQAALHDINLNPTDIDIQGGALSAIGNHFPWRIPAGETVEKLLVLTPDSSGQLTVILLEQGVQVELTDF